MEGIQFTAKYFLSEYGTDVYKICRKLGIHIQHHSLGENIKGYIMNIENLDLIVINNALEEWQKHLVLAHELGHFALHRDEPNQTTNSLYIDDTKLEYEATTFAMQLIGNKKYMTDYISPQFCEFIFKMYSSKKEGKNITSNTSAKRFILCGKPMTDDDVILLEQSIDSTIKFAKKLV